MTYLLDTDVLVDASRNRLSAKELIGRLASDGIAISGMTFGELWEGIIWSPQRSRSAHLLEEFLQSFTIHWPDRAIMELYGELRVHLRKQGQLINVPDILIACTAIRHDLVLVTRNHRHFSRIPELQLVAPADLAP